MVDVITTPGTQRLAFPAGYSVVRECLELQRQVPTRKGIARALGLSPLHPEARSWFGGALGEIRVGSLLEQLGPEWTVLHAVPVGTRGSDIDHVLVGPAGVFTVNTKRHPGARIWLGERMLMVAGQKTDHLRNSRHEAARAAKLLSAAAGEDVTVRSMLVLVGTGAITVKQRPSDVVVLTDRALVKWLNGRIAQLTPPQVAVLAAAASDPRTWKQKKVAAIDTTQAERFEALRVEEARAETVRLLWKAAGFAAVVIGAMSFALGML
ncbi:MAG: NERD domain-containing protein [Salinibacterium sp.]|nr:nuclease-related domain-containing protein [Salinibacterium sp.]MBF0671771.1 NERD domain-containing protein [Salinibacterium sp.]